MKPPKPENEEARLSVLKSLEILDTPAEESFDDIATLAAHICQTPICLVTLVDSERQWFKAKVGLDIPETSREDAFCAHAIVHPEDLLIVPDALADERFRDNPLVLSDPAIRFYAGAPLVTRDGHALGTLCVLDRVPRELGEEQLEALRALRRDVVSVLEMRRNLKRLARALENGDREREDLLQAQEELETQVLVRSTAQRRAYEELCALNRIVRTCSSSLDLGVTLDHVLDITLGVTGLEGGTVCLLSEDQSLQLVAHRGASQETVQDLSTHRVKVGECLCGGCAEDQKPLILEGREAVRRYASREAQRREEIHFHAAFPFVIAGRCVGVLCLFSRIPGRRPCDSALSLVGVVTAQVALAVEHARLYEETRHHAVELAEKVRERTAELEEKNLELERINKLFVGRELRMRELKERLRELEQRLNLPRGEES